jgi:hypothetical protein
VVLVSDCEVPVESATAFEKSLLAPTVHVDVGPTIMIPPVRLMEKPVVSVKVVECSFVTLDEVATEKLEE